MAQQFNSIFDDERIGTLLFHYTTISKAISILGTKALIFNDPRNQNDMNESCWTFICCYPDDKVVEVCEKAIYSYGQISLTCEDSPYCLNSRRGFDIATMWGHYAEGGNGACIVFNREKLLQEVSRIDAHSDWIDYKRDYDSALIFCTADPESEIKDHLQDIFFCKSDQWQHEQEFRIIKKNVRFIEYLSIASCIEGVIYAKLGATYGESVNDTRGYWSLKRVSSDIPLYGYDHRSPEGNRIIYQDLDGKMIWSSSGINELESNDWKVG